MAVNPQVVIKAILLLKGAITGEDKTARNIMLIIIAPFLILIILIVGIFEFATSPELWGGIDYSALSEHLESEYAGNDEFYSGDEIELIFRGKLPFPCSTTKVTSNYGLRRHPIDKTYKKHTGIDFATDWHSPITSVADGVVYKVKTDNTFGRNITIKHTIDGHTFYSFYAHLSAFEVKRGDEIIMGQVIGLEGGDPKNDTFVGKSTGHHLHFEIRLKPDYGSDVNPVNYLYKQTGEVKK